MYRRLVPWRVIQFFSGSFVIRTYSDTGRCRCGSVTFSSNARLRVSFNDRLPLRVCKYAISRPFSRSIRHSNALSPRNVLLPGADHEYISVRCRFHPIRLLSGQTLFYDIFWQSTWFSCRGVVNDTVATLRRDIIPEVRRRL